MNVAFLIDGSEISSSDHGMCEEELTHTEPTSAPHRSELIAGTILQLLGQLNRFTTESVETSTVAATPRSGQPPCSWAWKYTATSSDDAGVTGKRPFCPVHTQSFHAFCDDLSYHAKIHEERNESSYKSTDQSSNKIGTGIYYRAIAECLDDFDWGASPTAISAASRNPILNQSRSRNSTNSASSASSGSLVSGSRDVWATHSRHLFIVAPLPSSGADLAAALGVKKHSSNSPKSSKTRRYYEGQLSKCLLRKDLIHALNKQNICLHWIDTAGGTVDIQDTLGRDVISAGLRQHTCGSVLHAAEILLGPELIGLPTNIMHLLLSDPTTAAGSATQPSISSNSTMHVNTPSASPELPARVVHARVCPSVLNGACCVLELVPVASPVGYSDHLAQASGIAPPNAHVDVAYDTGGNTQGQRSHTGTSSGVHHGGSRSRKVKHRGRGLRPAVTCCLCPRSRIALSVVPRVLASAPMHMRNLSFYVTGLCADGIDPGVRAEHLHHGDVTNFRWSAWYTGLMTSLAASGEALVVSLLHPDTHVPCTAFLAPVTLVGGMLTIVDDVALHYRVPPPMAPTNGPDPTPPTPSCLCGRAFDSPRSRDTRSKRRRTGATHDAAADAAGRAATDTTACRRCRILPVGVAVTPLRPHVESCGERHPADDDATVGFDSSFLDWYAYNAPVERQRSRVTRDALDNAVRTALTTEAPTDMVHDQHIRASPSPTCQQTLLEFVSRTLQNADAGGENTDGAIVAGPDAGEHHGGSPSLGSVPDGHDGVPPAATDQPQPPSDMDDSTDGLPAECTLDVATHYRHRLSATARPPPQAMAMAFISQAPPQEADTCSEQRQHWDRVADDISGCMHDISAIDKILDESSTEGVAALAAIGTPGVTHGEYTIRLLQLQVVLRLHLLSIHQHQDASMTTTCPPADDDATDAMVARVTGDVLALMTRLSPLMDLFDADTNSLVLFLKSGLVPAFGPTVAPVLRLVFEDLELDRDMPSPLRVAVPLAAQSSPIVAGGGGDVVGDVFAPPSSDDRTGAVAMPALGGVARGVLTGLEDPPPDSATAATGDFRGRASAATATGARHASTGAGDDGVALQSQRGGARAPKSQALKQLESRQITVQFNRPARRPASHNTRSTRNAGKRRRKPTTTTSTSASNIVVLDTPAKDQQGSGSQPGGMGRGTATAGAVALPYVARRSRRPSANVVQESPAIQAAKARAKRHVSESPVRRSPRHTATRHMAPPATDATGAHCYPPRALCINDSDAPSMAPRSETRTYGAEPPAPPATSGHQGLVLSQRTAGTSVFTDNTTHGRGGGSHAARRSPRLASRAPPPKRSPRKSAKRVLNL
eukprot:m.1274880 g.1274880  ORF g.1274880 m.1274880 type:complete len:1339 (-) comp24759_c0_seq4:299-4315(-)